jgi:DNA-binding CsgD family transcriptional regulator
VNADGTPLWQTRQAAEWLKKYFPSDSLPSSKLPTVVTEWLTTELAKESDHLPLHAKNSGLELHLTIARRQRELLILLEEKSEEGSASLDHYQLTPRELDVLLWVAKGKTNRDIAEILGMSPRTVNKHLEHIYVKLGVETRSAAAALVAGKTNLT